MNGKNNINILMIEQDLEFVKNLTASLSKVKAFSFSLECAKTIEEAYTLAKTKDFNIILLDLFLTENQGLQTLKKVRLHLPSLPVIILTQNDDVDLAVNAVRFGAQDYLIKSRIDSHLLSLAIRYAVERKRTEQFQREQLHFLQSVMDNIPSPLYIKDTDLIYGACNAAFENLIGFSKEKIIGKSVFDLLEGVSSEVIREKELELLSGENTQVYELKIPHKEGKMVDMIFHETVHKRRDGSIAGLIGVATDISKMKRIEKTLKKAKASLEQKIAERTNEIRTINNKLRKQIKKRKALEKQLGIERKIFINGPVVVFRCSASEKAEVEYISANIKQIGYNAEDFKKNKMNFTDIIRKDYRQNVTNAINECIKAGKESLEQYFILKKRNGTEREVRCFINIGRDKTGKVTHFDGYIIDITDWEAKK